MTKGAPDYTKLVSLKGRDADGNDVSVLVDSAGRILALIRGVYAGAVLPVALDADGIMIARVRGKYGSTLVDAAVDSVGRLITTSAAATQHSNAAMDETTYNAIAKSGTQYILGTGTFLTQFTEADPGGQITVDSNTKVSVTAGLAGNLAYLYQDIASIQDFSINFEAQIDSDDVAYNYAFGIGFAVNGASYMTAAGWRLYVVYTTGSAFLMMGTDGDTAGIIISLGVLYYLTLSRVGTVATLSVYTDSARTIHKAGSPKTLTVATTAVTAFQALAARSATAISAATGFVQNISGSSAAPALAGTIKSNAIVATAADILYWRSLRMNLSKGGSTHASPLRIKFFGSSDSYAAALNANWVTIPESEYAELDLERAVVKTATGAGQTVWDFTSLTGADALVNEIGAQSVLVVERANDGSTYSVLTEDVDYTLDLTSRIAPRITLSSGTGIVSGTSKLRATVVVDVLKTDQTTKNTSIKVQIQENRTAGAETSPSIAPMPTEATVYVSGLWVLA